MSTKQKNLLTGIRDVDRLIIDELSDEDFLNMCSLNRTYAERVCTDDYFRLRTKARFPETIPYKVLPTWKNHYLSIVKYIDLLKREYNYDYVPSDENPEYLYIAMEYFTDSNPSNLSIDDSQYNEFSAEEGLLAAIQADDLDIVKYLVDVQRADIDFYDGDPLNIAIQIQSLEIIEYLMEAGAEYDIDDLLDKAQYNRNPLIIDYLESLEFP